ncbi:MAG: hypothetical protein JWM10_154, partial [Myxococcaceae bacterium]|nr:hypothetical protein [Myxococcaceae bacterium]
MYLRALVPALLALSLAAGCSADDAVVVPIADGGEA